MRKIRIEDGSVIDANNGFDLRCPHGGTCEIDCVACVVHDEVRPVRLECRAFGMLDIGEVDGD